MTRIACGFTANVDALGRLDESLLVRIAEACESRLAEPPSPPKSFLATWEDLRNAILWNMEQGSGAEYVVANDDILRQLRGFADWQWAVGGTGLQAACAACIAGHEALVNLPSWSDDYDFLLAHDGLVKEVKEQGRVPVHYIIEYRRGEVSNRIILRGRREFRDSLIAPAFSGRLLASPGQYRRLLISGYNAVDTSAEVARLLRETKRFLQSAGACCPPAHLELAAIFTPDDQLRIIRELGPHVDSIGLNEDELRELLRLDKPLLLLDDERLLDIMTAAHESFGVSNLIVHTSQFAACVSHDNASRWKEALRNGVRFAAAKAASGRFCTAPEIERWESQLPVHPRGARLARAAARSRNIALVPALQAAAVRTVGLGDTFTAGLLTAAPEI